MTDFGPQTAAGMTVHLYRSTYRSPACAWSKGDTTDPGRDPSPDTRRKP